VFKKKKKPGDANTIYHERKVKEREKKKKTTKTLPNLPFEPQKARVKIDVIGLRPAHPLI